MPKQQSVKKEKLVAGKTLDQWDEEWKPLDGGFGKDHKDVYGYVGLYRAVENGNVKYIGNGVQYQRGGLYRRLAVLRGKEQTGNSHYGAQRIREHIDTLALEILSVGKGGLNADYAKELKPLMVKRYDPIWNRPANRRLAAIFSKEG